jgi:ATP-dependent Clp protease adaptor protein ClpS
MKDERGFGPTVDPARHRVLALLKRPRAGAILAFDCRDRRGEVRSSGLLMSLWRNIMGRLPRRSGPTAEPTSGMDADPLHEFSADHADAYCLEILNDDFTPMEFVIMLLMRHCGLDHRRAVHLMLDVHMKGSAKIGRAREEAVEKLAEKMTAEARHFGHPLLVRASSCHGGAADETKV